MNGLAPLLGVAAVNADRIESLAPGAVNLTGKSGDKVEVFVELQYETLEAWSRDVLVEDPSDTDVWCLAILSWSEFGGYEVEVYDRTDDDPTADVLADALAALGQEGLVELDEATKISMGDIMSQRELEEQQNRSLVLLEKMGNEVERLRSQVAELLTWAEIGARSIQDLPGYSYDPLGDGIDHAGGLRLLERIKDCEFGVVSQ